MGPMGAGKSYLISAVCGVPDACLDDCAAGRAISAASVPGEAMPQRPRAFPSADVEESSPPSDIKEERIRTTTVKEEVESPAAFGEEETTPTSRDEETPRRTMRRGSSTPHRGIRSCSTIGTPLRTSTRSAQKPGAPSGTSSGAPTLRLGMSLVEVANCVLTALHFGDKTPLRFRRR